MSPFEAHVLIQQATTNPCARIGSSFPSRSDSKNSSIETILHQALISHRLNPNLRFKNESLLCTAIKKGCSNLLQLFLEHGADPNLKSYENGRYEPALHTAVRYKSLRSVQILLEYGANLSRTNFYGTDAIFQAVHENAFEILECLLCHEQSQQRHHVGENYLEEQETKDVPTRALSSSSSLPPALPPRPTPHHQSIIIQKTTATMKGKDSREGGNKATSAAVAAELVLNREKPSNNNNDSKGHEKDGDDDHVLCPFYYALNYALSYPSKRASLALLFQSNYKCKCLEEIASCCGQSSSRSSKLLNRTNFPMEEEEDQVKECLRLVLPSLPNFSPSWSRSAGSAAIGENKSVPPTTALHDEDDGVRQQGQYYYRAHHQLDTLEVDVDNENDIRFQFGEEGGEGNELSSSVSMFPYKVYKIQGKCHVIKENESSSSSSSPPLPAGAPPPATQQRRPSSSYVVLVGPLKLSCITREVIRDQIMRSTQTTCSPSNVSNGSTQSGSVNRTVAPQNPYYLPQLQPRSVGELTGAAQANSSLKWKRNFRKSLETLMMPSSLMDYILYRNIQWNNDDYRTPSADASSRRKSENERRQENKNNELSSPNIDNIRLIKRDLELNINYFAIYIY